MKGLNFTTMSRSMRSMRMMRSQSFTRPTSRTMYQRRWNSTEKPVSPHAGFYKTFTRPIAKVLLMATLAYQIVYWSWVKLEKDEIKAQKIEIKELEEELQKLIKLAEDAGIKVNS